MGSLNPHAADFVPSLSGPSEFFYSPPLSFPPPFYFLFNQTPYQTTMFYASPPCSDLCYYLPPQALYTCGVRKEFPFCPASQVLLAPRPLPFPTCRVEEVVEEKPQEKQVGSDDPQVKPGVEEGGLKDFKCNSLGGKRVLASRLRSTRRRAFPKAPKSKAPVEEFEFKREEIGEGDMDDSKTTVMIKNLPNKFTKEKLLGMLDQHCYIENEKLRSSKSDGGEPAAAFSEFDFFYLPIDFKSGSNLGYAFVNFTSAAAAWRLHHFLHNHEWRVQGSRKVCEVTYARIQGLPALLRHFKNSIFVCETDDFLPVWFTPSRDGYGQPPHHYIGKRVPSPARLTTPPVTK